MGASKKPISLKINDGTYRADRDGDLSKMVQPDTPKTNVAPSELKGDAVTFWNNHFDLCVKLGTLTIADVEAFTQLCRVVERIKESERILDSDGWVITTEKSTIRHPMAIQRDRFVSEWRSLGDRFGLNPSARSKLQIEPNTPKDSIVPSRKRG